MRNRLIIVAVATLAVTFTATGCGKRGTDVAPTQPVGGHDHAGHDHSGHDHAGHDHAHPHLGPHGGHLIELGEEEYHAEWTHNNATGELNFYILDGAVKNEVPIEANEIYIITTLEGQSPEEHALPAVDPQGDPPQTARFRIVDPVLVTKLQVQEGVHATLSVEIGGKQYVGVIEHHDHDHGHKH